MHHDTNLRGEFIGLVQQGDDLGKLPNMVANASFHRGSNTEGLMNTTKIVVHEVQRPMRESSP
jgi:hypothetical protein